MIWAKVLENCDHPRWIQRISLHPNKYIFTGGFNTNRSRKRTKVAQEVIMCCIFNASMFWNDKCPNTSRTHDTLSNNPANISSLEKLSSYLSMPHITCGASLWTWVFTPWMVYHARVSMRATNNTYEPHKLTRWHICLQQLYRHNRGQYTTASW